MARHDYSHGAVVRQWEDSLQRLGVSSVDSLVIHDLDRMFSTAEQCEGYMVALGLGGRNAAVYSCSCTSRQICCYNRYTSIPELAIRPNPRWSSRAASVRWRSSGPREKSK